MKEKILSYFEIEKLNTTVKREVLAGFTTFISMAYILFVNPTVLGASGMDEGAVFTATALASAIGCVLMGVLARYPIGTAPALGINAFFCLFCLFRNGDSMGNSISRRIRCFFDFYFDHNLQAAGNDH